MHIVSKGFLICSVLLVSIGQTSIYAEDNTTTNKKATFWQRHPDLKRYGAHTLTGFTSHIVAAATIILTATLSASHVKDGQNIKEILAKCILPTTIAGIASVYTVFKTPQWTDTYILKNGKKRTTIQNMSNFCVRVLIGAPFGYALGECCSEMLEEEKPIDPATSTVSTN